MAFTVSSEKSVFGNKAVVILKVSADGAEANISTGLGHIDAISVAMISCATGTALPHLAINSNSSGLASEGVLGVSGVTSGDVFHVVCYGR